MMTSKKVNVSSVGLRLIAALVVLLAGASSCGVDGNGTAGGIASPSTFRPSSCAVSKNNFGHPQSCQCASPSHYDERHGVCSSNTASR